jgi:hypothetical protein
MRKKIEELLAEKEYSSISSPKRAVSSPLQVGWAKLS